MTPMPPSPQTQGTRFVLTLIAIALIVVGMSIINLAPNSLELGLLLAFAGCAFLVWVNRRDPAPRVVRGMARLRLTPRRGLVGLSLALAVLTVLASNWTSQQSRFDYSLTWVLWGASMLALVAAFAEQPTISVRDWVRAHRTELIALGLVTVLGLVLRMYQLGQLPRVIDGDEGLNGIFALTTNRGELANPFSMFANIGSVYLHVVNLFVNLFGQTPVGLRFMSALAGTLAIPATYLLARQLFDRRVALFSALLLAMSHAHLHFSRIASVPYITGTFFVPLELFLFSRALLRRSAFSAAVGGVVLAIHFSFYLTAQIVIAFLIVYLVILVLARQPVLRQSTRQMLVFWLCAGIVALPQLTYNSQHPEQVMARLAADGTMQTGWLDEQMAATGQSAVHILAGRVVHVFLALIADPVIDFYNTPWPMLGTITAGLFLIGVVLALVRTRDVRYLLINGYFWSIVVAIGLFALPPGADAYRSLAALPAAMILAALGLREILNASSLEVLTQPKVQSGVLIALFTAVFLLNTNAYFNDFAGRCRFGGDVSTRFASYLGNYLRGVERESTVYLLSTDQIFHGAHRSIDFLSHKMPVTNLQEPVNTLSVEPNAVVIAPLDRADELRDWVRMHPDGELHYEYDCERLILLAYQLP